MMLYLLGSTLAFVGGTALMRNRLLKQQSVAEAERVMAILNQRVENVTTATSLLANDSKIVEAVQKESETALSTLNNRAMVVHDRFGLALIQINDRHGQAHINLMLPNLYRESSMLNMTEPDRPVVRVVGDRLLLLNRATMPNGAGTVVAGVDLETELRRIPAEYRLSSDLSLSVRGVSVGTRARPPSGAADAWSDGEYRQALPITLGATSAELLLVRPTTEVERVTNVGLLVMVGSTLLTTLLLSGLNVAVTRSIARPIHRLSIAAEAVAQGDLNQEVVLPFAISDEHLLAHALPHDVDILNINIPADATPRTPWRLTRLSRRRYFLPIAPDRDNGEGRPGYKLLEDLQQAEPDSDVRAIMVDQVISVTPLSLDLTSRVSFDVADRRLPVDRTARSSDLFGLPTRLTIGNWIENPSPAMGCQIGKVRHEVDLT